MEADLPAVPANLRIPGTRWLQTFSTEVGLASQVAYYSLTTLLGELTPSFRCVRHFELTLASIAIRLPGSQTLGEEYVDILQYSSRTRKIPPLLVCLAPKRHCLLGHHS